MAGHIFWTEEDENGNLEVYTNSQDTWHGVEGSTFIWHGEWSDPEVYYDGELLNGSDLEDNAWAEYCYDCKEFGKEPSEDEYDNLPASWFKEYLDWSYIPGLKGY